MNSSRAERQTDDGQAIKGGLMLPNIQTPNFSVWDESIHFQHNLKVLVRFPKSHSLQDLVVSWVYLNANHMKKTLHCCYKKMNHEGKLLLPKEVMKIKWTARSFDIIIFSCRKGSEECLSRNIYRDALNILTSSAGWYDNQLKIYLWQPTNPLLS
jgi:hypothetical protein